MGGPDKPGHDDWGRTASASQRLSEFIAAQLLGAAAAVVVLGWLVNAVSASAQSSA